MVLKVRMRPNLSQRLTSRHAGRIGVEGLNKELKSQRLTAVVMKHEKAEEGPKSKLDGDGRGNLYHS